MVAAGSEEAPGVADQRLAGHSSAGRDLADVAACEVEADVVDGAERVPDRAAAYPGTDLPDP